MTLVASTREELFQLYELDADREVMGVLTLNPLYQVEPADDGSVLTLTFPSPEYEEEFGACRRYLPDQITVKGDMRAPIAPDELGPAHARLVERRVIIDAPDGYC